MNKAKSKWLGLLVGIVIFLLLTSAYTSGNFVKIKLPNGVSIELPKNWVVISKDQRITLDTMVESKLDLAGIDQEKADFPFAANYYKNGKTVGIINTRYYSNIDLSQNDARQTTPQDINELDAALKEGVVKSMSAFGMSILSWEGTKRSTINGITAFVTEYHRKSLKGTGAFRVRLVRVFAGNRSFTLTVSYSEDEAFLLKTITDRIISSLRLTGINEASSETYHSSFGFTINIPTHWLIMSKQEVKDNPDLFDFENELFKNTDKAMLNQIKNMILSGKFEMYFNQNTTDAYFRDNINVFIQIGRLPQTVSESKKVCKSIPGELSRACGKHIKVYNCGLRKVSGLNALYSEFDGVADGTRSIQYQIQKSPSVIILLTATCKNKSLRIIKKEYEDIVSSIKIE